VSQLFFFFFSFFLFDSPNKTYSDIFFEKIPVVPDTMMMLEGILKLATKYQIDPLRARVVAVLQSEWPTSLQNWDSIMQKEKVVRQFPGHIIRIARDFDVPNVLPIAFYELSMQLWPASMALGAWRHLTIDDMVLVVRGKDAMSALLANLPHKIGLCKHDHCRKAFFSIWLLFHQQLHEERRPLEAMHVMLKKIRSKKQSFTEDCWKLLVKKLEEHRQMVFSELRSIFNLPKVCTTGDS
jgi:hypothetical protein